MIYPFEQVKNYTNNFLNPEDKEQFNTLKNLVNSYDERGVNAWFKQKKSWLKTKGKENLAKAIGYSTYYFNVKSSLGTKKEDLEDLEYKQIIILLKNFELEQQLIILTQNFKMESEDIFKLLFETAKTEKKENILYNSRIILDPLIAIYSRHEFDKLKILESIIEKKVVNLESNKVAFLVKDGGSYFKLKNSYFITDEIIFNYSPEKRDFIMSHGKEIPLKEKAYQLLEDITQDYEKRDWNSVGDMENLKNITKNINIFIKAILYFDFNKKFPKNNNNPNNNIKI